MLEGAESVLEPCKFAGFDALKKVRLEKKYRPRELDEKLRFERTRCEARLLHKAKEAGVLCPHVFAIGKDSIIVERIAGKTLNRIGKIDGKVYSDAGKILSKLHSANIVHGDYTTANLMFDSKKLQVIDFGLGFVSSEIEDKAVDLLTFVDSVNSEAGEKFLAGYSLHGDRKVMAKMNEIESRARYKKRKQTE